ncbi:MAG: hypothetical protein PHN80_06655 [Hespellia sp.]|nr:hypothetical protein [Hespellia sp.]
MNGWTNLMQNSQVESALKDAGISAGTFTEIGTIAVVAVLVIAVLHCFLGLKLVRVWSGILGLALGFGVGSGVASMFKLESMITMIIGVAVGILFAVLGLWLFKVGMFFICWLLIAGIVMGAFPELNAVAAATGIITGLIAAILSVKLFEPVAIIATSLWGGLTAGSGIVFLLGLSPAYLEYVIGAAIVVLGIIVQFALESHKKVKQHKAKASEIRAKESTETEVEKARAMVDHLDDDDDDDIEIMEEDFEYDDED